MLMSETGQSRPKWAVHPISAFPPIATRPRTSRDVSNVPTSDIGISAWVWTMTRDRSQKRLGRGCHLSLRRRCVISAPGCGGPAAAHAACDVSRPCQAHVLHPQFVNRCFGGIHGCHPVWGFPARTDAGNGVCGLGAADGSRGLHARRATGMYRRRVSLMQRRDSKRRPRQGLPAQEQGAA